MTASREQRLHVAAYARARLLDLPIDKIRLSELLEWVVTRAKQGTTSTVLYVNVHCMNVASRDRQYANILKDADLVYCDGTG
ncbi:MAG: hypothetical protein M3Z66_10305, partial [Chloroflexota bacterium]|nr:hypothetical protein [Chloroflexota bacterium]